METTNNKKTIFKAIENLNSVTLGGGIFLIHNQRLMNFFIVLIQYIFRTIHHAFKIIFR